MNKEKLVQIAVLLLRVVAGLIFIENGGLKLFGWFGGIPGGHLPTLLLVAGILEFVGGIAILLGLLTRPIAFVLSSEMAVAYFLGHGSHGHFFVPLLNQGQPAVLLCFIFLFFAAYGAGEWSVEAMLKNRSTDMMAKSS
ncbi:MAG: DoxX family protein [Candidatus Doudnabacteria bacterium]|nr:DoxX family protein [Candidatus Doudnabacteria bacterium]